MPAAKGSARTPLGPIKDDMEVETEANVYEPFDEYVKQVEMKVENEMNVHVLG
jgi:hypothetical protein